MVCVYLHSFNKNNIIQEESVKEQSCFAASLIALSATRQPTTDYPLCFLLTLYVNDDVKWSIKHSPGQQLLCLKKSCFKIPTTYGLGLIFDWLRAVLTSYEPAKWQTAGWWEQRQKKEKCPAADRAWWTLSDNPNPKAVWFIFCLNHFENLN